MSVLLALLWDWRFGEPPAKLHPVVWMGHYLRWAGRGLTEQPPRAALALGTAGWLLGAALVVLVYGALERSIAPLPLWAGAILGACLLKPLFAFRMLLEEARYVEEALEEGLEQGRWRLSRIVSRDTRSLDEAEVREGALESLSENLSDSLVAPLFWFLLLGLPGAALYRFANTADAMWGYRGEWEWAGRFAARADDLLSWLPARLTALVLWLCRPGFSLRGLAAEARQTPSPNSGWPMAALALGLGVRLGKPGVYVLNPQGRRPTARDFALGLSWTARAGWGAGLVFALFELGRVAHA
ncbi:adenosylcobinamide-phosphate synthase CbiB [Calidithermus timidus]|uniref:adenosylcobinamide-phosphate synthase CbiB n=1 Tax=Calidithermus timidus TaxID=307124 RepID=UPI0003A1D4A0|nr:adenosylcobinamide-phosphate synthase CbiB [Calidithermus timidus]